MSDFTTNLQLPYLMPAQAQKHVTVNEALARLDALCQANAISMSTTAQPGSPADGDVYIIPSGKTGTDWASATNWDIGYYQDGLWHFVTPREGWLVWVKDADGLFAWGGSSWVRIDVRTETVRSAGALMDDELANLAAVKAINQGLATTGTPQFSRIGVGVAADGGTPGMFATSANTIGVFVNPTHASYTASAIQTTCARAASSEYNMITAYSGSGADLEFRVRGDGEATADGSFSGGGADYAERFEWADGNPDNEDRIGYSVVLAGNKVRIATADDDPSAIIGAVSINAVVVGDDGGLRWPGKYLRDDFGAYLMEDYQVVEWTEPPKKKGAEPVVRTYALDALPEGVTPPADAVITTQQRRVLNPDFDPDAPYTPRADRPEWATIGLVGKLRLRKGQPVGDRWIKMRDVSAEVEEWLVR